MKKTKFLALILCLSFLCPLLLPATAYADDPPANSGMKVSKTATANSDGSYTITLEAFATGSQTTSTQTEDVPTDIILVLDQSGSMAYDIGQVQYKKYSNTQNKNNYEKRHNGGSANLWHKLDDGSYVSVSVTKTTPYKALSTDLPNYNYWNECYWDYANNLYEKVGDEYKKVTVSYDGNAFSGYTYTYAFADGTTVESEGNSSKPNFGSRAPLYTPDANVNNTVYTYTYTDSAGVLQAIGTSSIGANTRFTPAFYQRSVSTSGGGSRLDALKSAANAFASAVAAKAAGNPAERINPINHRIAVVGFASESGNGNNTELLSIAGNNSGSVGVAYNSITNQNLKDVLQSMDTQNGRDMVNAAINALAANGATRTDLGMDMAQQILSANPVPQNETRNRVVIVFTDGSPTDSNGFELGVANTAINKAKAIKESGATVYSIGIFSGADASSAGTKPSNDLNNNSRQLTAACNWFMQQVSSNNGTPRYPSYYLSAGDAASLNSIFQQISNNITTGGSSTTLGSETVVKDIISPYFTLPAGTTARDIQIDTYECKGKKGDTYTWSSASGGNGGASAKVNGDQVSVTGFDFSENWCGTETDANGKTTAHGKKLVISFTVYPKNGFLGGNDVPTNASAGIYENSSAQTPVITFERPTVNVPIKDVTVTAKDKNVYLKGEVTADQLKTGTEISVGDVKLDLSKATDTDKPWGLEPWQTEFVNITVAVKDKDGIPISDKLDNLTDDTTYTVEVTVAPKTVGTSTLAKGDAATAKTGVNDPAANIYVFKPELTFKDSTAYYGETVAADFSGNKVSEVWKHDNKEAVPAEMTGNKPDLTIAYTPDGTKLDGTKYGKQDVPVTATVKIGTENVNEHTTFVHQDCTPACGWTAATTPNGNPAFLLHVKTCTLTITKTDGAANEPYVFNVYKNGEKYTEVTVWGNGTETLVELPIGTYTISENTGWSWRYPNPTYTTAIELSAAQTSGTITCTNKLENNYWLNGFSHVVKNIFGISH